ncbi:MAG: VCBS repeat-containing protein, partial [Thermoguttaceae bacterium]|nr:VCBS repeat-containing protein [Thermoguttaceae bacterium]
YGLAWYKQVRGDNGEITFEKNVLIPADPDDGFFPKVSQLHSMAAADFNGDGVDDFVTGKRFWAHGSKGDVNPNDPAVLMWWEVQPAGDQTRVIPHVIDEDSGVGTQVWTSDMNGDGRPDILVSNKKGIFVFLSEKE